MLDAPQLRRFLVRLRGQCLSAGLPITDLSIGDPNDRTTWKPEWAEGTVLTPALESQFVSIRDSVTDAPLPEEQDDVDAKAYPKLRALAAMTPAEVGAWVDANVTTLATAKDAIRTLAIAVSVLIRRL